MGIVQRGTMQTGRAAEVKSELSVYQDRIIFLKAISEAPEFWRSLRKTVLPHFPDNVSAQTIRRGYMAPALAAIQEPFRAWAEGFSIQSVYWLHAVALRTLRMWLEHPAMQGFDPGAASEWNDEVVFQFSVKLETKRAIRERLNQILDATDSDDDEECPVILNESHAVWLALHQFAGLSARQIQQWELSRGRTIGVVRAKANVRDIPDVSVIRKGYKAAADRLGIPRTSKPGRPKK
jgi:hypothetical protein